MGFFWKSKADKSTQDLLIEALKAENIYLRTLISDLQSQIRDSTNQHQQERNELLDRFTNLVAPTPRLRATSPSSTPFIPTWPGYRPDLPDDAPQS